MHYTAKEIKLLLTTTGTRYGNGIDPVRPHSITGFRGLCLRIKRVWGVITGKYDTVSW